MIDYRLTNNEIHIWLAKAPDSCTAPKDTLSCNEKDRVARLVQTKHRRMKQFSYFARREILSLYTGIMPKDIVFSSEHKKKPCLSNSDSLCFNISDSNNIMAIAISKHSVGIDIEDPSRPIHANRAEQYVLSESEKEIWSGLDKKQQHSFLLQAWVAKEAYLKKLGCGLHAKMNQLTVIAKHETSKLSELTSPDNQTHLHWITTNQDIIMAIACNANTQKIKLRHFTASDFSS